MSVAVFYLELYKEHGFYVGIYYWTNMTAILCNVYVYMLELSNRPTLALYMGYPEQLIPHWDQEPKTSAFFCPPREMSQSRPTQGGQRNQKMNFQTIRRRPNPGLQGTLNEEGQPQGREYKKILELLNL